MSNYGLRSFLALAVLSGSALPGFIGAQGVAFAAPVAPEPVDPTGGCWRYVPGPDAELPIDDMTGATDVSIAAEPWGLEPGVLFTTSGPTAVGGQRALALAFNPGPLVVPVLAGEGTAHVFVDVVDAASQRTELAPIEVPFELGLTDLQLPALVAEGVLPIAAAGTHTLILRNVIYDLPDALGGPQRIACNGQTDAVSGGDNPASAPVDTAVTAQFVAAEASGLAVTQVAGQKVLGLARGGDTVHLALTGLPSEAALEVALCAPAAADEAAPVCAAPNAVTTLADGSATVAVAVPDAQAAGESTIRVTEVAEDAEDPVVQRAQADAVVTPLVELPFRVLGAPEIEVADDAEERRPRIAGGEWDPQRQVRVRAVDGDGARVGKAAKVSADATGALATELTIPDGREVAEVVATQRRPGGELEARLDYPISKTPGKDDSGTTTDSPGSSNSSSSSSSSSDSSAQAPAAADIPEPDPSLDPKVVPAPGDPVAVVGDVAVTRAVLDGSTRFADLFGAGPRRTLRMTVENIGEGEVTAPGLQIAVGKDDDLDPIYRSDGFGKLGPGEFVNIDVPISLPAGAFGTYSISGQIGEAAGGRFVLQWETYPWGLLALNGLGILLVAWAVRRRLVVPSPGLAAALAGPPLAGAAVAPAGAAAGAAVIDLAALDRWWSLKDAAAVSGPDGLALTGLDDAVVDLDAVERWLERCAQRDVTSR